VKVFVGVDKGRRKKSIDLGLFVKGRMAMAAIQTLLPGQQQQY
jgi:hypothetical protein